ncbi:MAG TPA: type II toxin-antitoxin system RelE/ParE family toxin [Thermomicrobiales bacterium]|jgi:mRNA interferase RelE/StbE
MRYRVDLAKRAQRQFRNLSPDVQKRVLPRIRALADDPRPPGAIRLAGEEGLFRIRVGDYRVIYAIEDDVLLVLVVAVGHRKEIYRDL